MTEKYYLTKNGGETFEEMSLAGIGSEVLTYEGNDYEVYATYEIRTRRYYQGNFGPYRSLPHHLSYTSDGIDIVVEHPDEAENALLENVGQNFIDTGTWDHIPDYWQAYTEEGYEEELQWQKDNGGA